MIGAITLPAVKAWVAAESLPLLAAPQPGDPGGQGEDYGKSSPVGLLVLILFFIAVGFLVRSMSKHLRKVPASFDPPSEESKEQAGEEDAEERAKRSEQSEEDTGATKDEEPADGSAAGGTPGGGGATDRSTAAEQPGPARPAKPAEVDSRGGTKRPGRG